MRAKVPTFRTTTFEISSSTRLVSLVFGKGLMSLYGTTMSDGNGASLFHTSCFCCSRKSFAWWIHIVYTVALRWLIATSETYKIFLLETRKFMFVAEQFRFDSCRCLRTYWCRGKLQKRFCTDIARMTEHVLLSALPKKHRGPGRICTLYTVGELPSIVHQRKYLYPRGEQSSRTFFYRAQWSVGRRCCMHCCLVFAFEVIWCVFSSFNVALFVEQSSIEETLQRIKSTQVLAFHTAARPTHACSAALHYSYILNSVTVLLLYPHHLGNSCAHVYIQGVQGFVIINDRCEILRKSDNMCVYWTQMNKMILEKLKQHPAFWYMAFSCKW